MEQTQTDIVHKSKLEKAANSKVFYSAKAHTIGGREGASKTDDGILDISLATPGTSRKGTNPEQLFATGWSACFLSALTIVARKMKVPYPQDAFIDAEVNLLLAGEDFSLQGRLNISLPGVDREVAKQMIEAATHVCPYSKAVEGNIDVTYHLIEKN